MFRIIKKTDPDGNSGEWGEALAKRFLCKKGMKCLGTRVRVPPHDEIDLIMRDSGIVVFVEVKTRATEDLGSPAEAVDMQKKYRLSRAAVRFLSRKKSEPVDFRFDIVEVIGKPRSDPPVIRHHIDAFPLADGFYPPF